MKVVTPPARMTVWPRIQSPASLITSSSSRPSSGRSKVRAILLPRTTPERTRTTTSKKRRIVLPTTNWPRAAMPSFNRLQRISQLPPSRFPARCRLRWLAWSKTKVGPRRARPSPRRGGMKSEWLKSQRMKQQEKLLVEKKTWTRVWGLPVLPTIICKVWKLFLLIFKSSMYCYILGLYR